MIHYHQTGADESTSILLTFPSAPHNPKPAMGIALTNLRVATDPDGKGTAGTISQVKVGDHVAVTGTGTGPLTAKRVLDRGAGTTK